MFVDTGQPGGLCALDGRGEQPGRGHAAAVWLGAAHLHARARARHRRCRARRPGRKIAGAYCSLLINMFMCRL